MSSWRVARGLEKLLEQINNVAPRRSRASDGSIGDAAHQATPSDHNPDRHGVVRARDFTHDPARGADMNDIAEALRASRDRRIKYVIWNRRIFSATGRSWRWRSYSGSNPHNHHMHVSVVATSVADDTREWEIGMGALDEVVDGNTTLRSAIRVLLARTNADVNVERYLAREQRAEILAEVRKVLDEVTRDPADDLKFSEAQIARLGVRIVDCIPAQRTPSNIEDAANDESAAYQHQA